MNTELNAADFANAHKNGKNSFTRTRKLPFVMVFLLVLKKSVKSLQNRLNEFFLHNDLPSTITNSAFSQARQKLSHTAFLHLNDRTVSFYYRDDDIKRLRGFRCLGIDGSGPCPSPWGQWLRG
jgi:hypothetical protein